jgi:PPM family protein phosphatase
MVALVEEQDLIIHGSSHVGLVHETQEDSWTVADTGDGGKLLLICDGMGGMGKGDEASAMAVEVLTRVLEDGDPHPPARLRESIRIADTTVRKRLCDQQQGMPGSTAVMAWIKDGLAWVCWVGDSRCYLVRGGEVVERTRDHKLVADLIEAGQLTEEEAKQSALAHVVTRALGGRTPADPPVRPESLMTPWALQTGDYVVLCSDGICDLVTDAELPEFIGLADPDEACEVLTQVALDRGGHDNATLIVARWDGINVEAPEDLKSTPLFAPSRHSLPEDEDTDPGQEREDDFVDIETDDHTDESIYADDMDTSDLADDDDPITDASIFAGEQPESEDPDPWLAAFLISACILVCTVVLWQMAP